MEQIKNSLPENPEQKQLSGKEKIEVVLALFGTDEARENFIQNCRGYIEARDKADKESRSANSLVRPRAIASSPKQAAIHNRIMDTLTRLASQLPESKRTPLQFDIFREIADRDVAAKFIREYVYYLEGLPKPADEDNEDNEGRRKGMSDTAYYHSLGREH